MHSCTIHIAFLIPTKPRYTESSEDGLPKQHMKKGIWWLFVWVSRQSVVRYCSSVVASAWVGATWINVYVWVPCMFLCTCRRKSDLQKKRFVAEVKTIWIQHNQHITTETAQKHNPNHKNNTRTKTPPPCKVKTTTTTTAKQKHRKIQNNTPLQKHNYHNTIGLYWTATERHKDITTKNPTQKHLQSTTNKTTSKHHHYHHNITTCWFEPILVESLHPGRAMMDPWALRNWVCWGHVVADSCEKKTQPCMNSSQEWDYDY